MFRSAELGHRITKDEYAALEAELRPRLVQAQLKAHELDVPLVLLFNGVDGAGKSETVTHLLEWLDPRLVDVHALEKPTETERELPYLYRHWRRLPRKGRTSIFLGSWYSPSILQRVYGKTDDGGFRRELADIVRFEELLAEEGWPILKFWMHLAKDVQRRRLKRLEKDKDTSWRVTKRDWKHFKLYDEFVVTSAEALRRTSAAHAPWYVVEGADRRYREVEVTRRVLHALESRVADAQERRATKAAKLAPAEDSPPPPPPKPARRSKKVKGAEAVAAPSVAGVPLAGSVDPNLVASDGRNLLDSMDLTLRLDKAEYRKRLQAARARVNRLARLCYDAGHSAVLVFEGCDAAGKGGAIRRTVRGMHPKTYRIVPVAAPTPTELSYPYLWRFWMHLPRDGKVTIFDRSWYGRVLVERVEGFCSEADWRRAYAEIRDFEDQVHRSGTRVVKFWLQISEDEQLARFKAREVTPHKAHKITDEDWRNREKWPQYKAAVCEMIDRTDSTNAPWVLVEAEDKQWARIKVIETVCETLEGML